MNNATAKAFRAVGTALVVSGMMTACTVFPTPEAPRVMDFPTPQNVEKSVTSRPQSLRVDTPFASEPFNSTRILAKPEPWEFRVYHGVRWRDTVPVILRDMLVGAFRTSASFRDVSMDTGPGNTDLTLATEITAFHTLSQGDSTRVTVAIYGQLIDNRSRVTLCSDSFIASMPAKDNSIESVVQAFGSAGESLAKDVIGWATACETRPDQAFSGNRSGQAALR
ncbi:MAG: membrane integrity-associated transporter subunit PqiC [Marinobacter sp.]|uniref:ABC-type transport auxiliary lipoprotein family protein n=1 Tax=Marinobacter sp. TaxID=50741 RepID=UPI001B6B64BB|nr:ABC-type transport auxiliary lipoprotein family protein [Marinobacter sp.]MBQ0745028.1 membrane integrity-associated transporter subunit PqiC [Marinobacter sp.]MBQ0815811.1 membrane integrity-associated transporter subunit PqiC [Marinobacter sp.]